MTQFAIFLFVVCYKFFVNRIIQIRTPKAGVDNVQRGIPHGRECGLIGGERRGIKRYFFFQPGLCILFDEIDTHSSRVKYE